MMLEAIRLECSRRLRPSQAERIRIVLSTLGADAVAIGAARGAALAGAMILLTGADIVLPDRVLTAGSLLVDGDRIVAIEPRVIDAPAGATRIDVPGALIVPGFIDVHVHGVEGVDVLDGAGAMAKVAARLPRYGVTSFCPTSVACTPAALDAMLEDVARAQAPERGRGARAAGASRKQFHQPGVQGRAAGGVPAHAAVRRRTARPARRTRRTSPAPTSSTVIARRRDQVGIVTMAPEIDGGLDLVRRLTAAGHRVSIGHTGATYEQALEAIDAGVVPRDASLQSHDADDASRARRPRRRARRRSASPRS